jgi:hypothetical protein
MGNNFTGGCRAEYEEPKIKKVRFEGTSRRKLLCHLVLIFLIACIFPGYVSPEVFDPGKAGFAVKFRDVVSSYRVLGVYVLPGESLTVEILDSPGKNTYSFKPSGGSSKQTSKMKWAWKAPRGTGLYPLEISQGGGGDSITLNMFVMVPESATKNRCINDYMIGEYPSPPEDENTPYEAPKGFIEVTRENQDTPVSPHFRLYQFLCKQEGDYPKYIVLQEKLLLKLEGILGEVNREGLSAETLAILSGYRTPHYNRSIGNVKYSFHLFGGAADIFIDTNPQDDIMDDLNRDGKVNRKDAAVLYNIIEKMDRRSQSESYPGGLSIYRRTESHGPFVHVDVRGYPARWGSRR